jgi:hypothetical protein
MSMTPAETTTRVTTAARAAVPGGAAGPVPGRLPSGLGMLMLLPDARVAGAVRALGRRISLLAPDVLAALPVTVSPALAARLYRHNGTPAGPGQVDSSWLGRRVFSRGPCVLVLVRTRAPVDDVSGLLAGCMGPTTAGTRPKGALREVAAYAHKGMSLLHTPDDAEQAWADLRLFLDPVLFDALLAGPRTPVTWDDLELLHAPVAPAVELTQRRFLQRVYAKSLTLLGVDARLAPWWRSAESPHRVARALWDGELDIADAPLPDPSALVPRARPADPLAAMSLRRAIGRRRDLAAVLAMAPGHSGAGRFAELALSVLTENGVVEGDWEEHMVLVGLTNPTHPGPPARPADAPAAREPAAGDGAAARPTTPARDRRPTRTQLGV